MCKNFRTKRLPKEAGATARRKAKAQSKASASTTNVSKQTPKAEKEFNPNTYKIHAMGDYVDHIRRFGTTDSYSTQRGELEHRRAKQLYGRTNKRNAATQIAKLEQRQRYLQRSDITERNLLEQLPKLPPEKHYGMASTVRSQNIINVYYWLNEHQGDPALRDFLPRLQDHLLSRLLGNVFYGDEQLYTNSDRSKLSLLKDQLFQHTVLRLNYTAYDMRRDQDSINARTHADIMVLSGEGESDSLAQPYWYARVIGIFQATIQFNDPDSPKNGIHQMDFLFVRWFGEDPDNCSGFKAKRLPRIGFVPQEDEAAFGFIDPDQVIRGVHLIPAFAYGQTSALLGKSFIRRDCKEDMDWQYYYVNSFVDRDMFMRFVGGGVGHQKYGALFKESTSDVSADNLDLEQDVLILKEMEAEAKAAERCRNPKGKEANEVISEQPGANEPEDENMLLDGDDDESSDDLADSEDELDSVFDFS